MVVKNKKTGQYGTLPDNQFDPSMYEQVAAPQPTGPTMANGTPAVQPQKSVARNIGDFVLKNVIAPVYNPLAEAVNNTLADTAKNTNDPRNKGNIGMSVKNAVKSTASLAANTVGNPKVLAAEASLAVPFGKAGFMGSKFVAPGAAQGALMGTAQGDDPTELLGDIAVGAGTGALLQGGGAAVRKAIGGQNKAADAMKNAGKGMNKNILNAQAQPDVFYSTNIAQLEKVADELKINKGSARDRLDKLPGIFKNIDSQIKPRLQNVTTPIKDDVVASNFDTMLSKNSTFAADDPALIKARQQVLDRYTNLGGVGNQPKTLILDAQGNPITSPTPPKTALQVYEYKSELRGELTQAFNKIEKGNLNLTPVEEAKMAMYQGLKSTIDEVAPEVRGLNDTEHYMFDIAKGLVKKSNKPGGVNLGPVRVPAPTGVTQKVQSAVGSGLEKAGGVKLPQIPAPGFVGGQVGTRTAFAATSGNDQSQNPENAIGDQVQNYDGKDNTDNNAHITSDSNTVGQESQESHYVTGVSPEQHAQAYIAALQAGDTKSAAQIKALYEMESKYQESNAGGAKPLSAVAQTAVTKANTGLKSVERMEQLLEKDPIALWKKFNPLDQTGRSLGADLASTIDIIGYFRTGAAITADQRKDYYYMFPTAFDAPELQKEKIRRIKAELSGYAGIGTVTPELAPTTTETGLQFSNGQPAFSQ